MSHTGEEARLTPPSAATSSTPGLKNLKRYEEGKAKSGKTTGPQIVWEGTRGGGNLLRELREGRDLLSSQLPHSHGGQVLRRIAVLSRPHLLRRFSSFE